ncbi:MAG: hypothetical protein ABI685_12790 [Ferruginibacter sp.]
MIYWVSVYMSFTVCIAAVIAAVRFRKLDRVYLPFILSIWIASINEIISFSIAQKGYSNYANNNIYILAEGLLILWQFKNWELFNRAWMLPVGLAIGLVGTWIYEIHSLETLNQLHYYYRLLYAAIVVICSINIQNRLIISHNHRLLTNPVFFICIAYILYFTLKILTDTYWIYNPKSSTVFLTAVFYSMACNNLITNLLFIIAVLWIPRKPDYITF